MCQSKPINFNINLYTDHSVLWVKHATHQKAEFLRAASLSKLDNRVNNNSIFNTKYAEFSTKWYVLLHFHNPTCAYNNFKIFTKNRSSTSVNFYLPIPPLLVNKIILTISINTTFLYTSAIFHLIIFAYNCLSNGNQKHFSCISHLSNSDCVKGSGR